MFDDEPLGVINLFEIAKVAKTLLVWDMLCLDVIFVVIILWIILIENEEREESVEEIKRS